jgi:hypothetical protein
MRGLSQNVAVNVVSWSIIALLASVIALDAWAIVRKQGATDTISAHLRNWNAATGGVISLFTAALWIHLFARLPRSWTEAAAHPFGAASYT